MKYDETLHLDEGNLILSILQNKQGVLRDNTFCHSLFSKLNASKSHFRLHNNCLVNRILSSKFEGMR